MNGLPTDANGARILLSFQIVEIVKIMSFTTILWVGLGGFFGAISRYIFYFLTKISFPTANFPIATLIINTSGCFIAGLLSGWFSRKGISTDHALNLIFSIGFLGAFTTFSAFSVETIVLFDRGFPLFAILNILLNVGLGLVGMYLGRLLVLNTA